MSREGNDSPTLESPHIFDCPSSGFAARVDCRLISPSRAVRRQSMRKFIMAKRKWIVGSLYLTIGILVGHIIGSSTARSPTIVRAGIPLAIAVPNRAAVDGPSLKLTEVTFCHKISNYGNYLKYDRDEFWAGQEVLIYAEIGDLHSEQIPDGNFRTLVKSTIEIFRDGELQ